MNDICNSVFYFKSQPNTYNFKGVSFGPPFVGTVAGVVFALFGRVFYAHVRNPFFDYKKAGLQ